MSTKQEIMVTDHIGLVLDDTLITKLLVVNGKQLKRGKTARLARIRRNLIREIKALEKEQRRFPKDWWVKS